MPEVGPGNVDSPAWAATFPEAYRHIQAAIDFLRNDKSVERVYLMGHSMGGPIAHAHTDVAAQSAHATL